MEWNRWYCISQMQSAAKWAWSWGIVAATKSFASFLHNIGHKNLEQISMDALRKIALRKMSYLSWLITISKTTYFQMAKLPNIFESREAVLIFFLASNEKANYFVLWNGSPRRLKTFETSNNGPMCFENDHACVFPLSSCIFSIFSAFSCGSDSQRL